MICRATECGVMCLMVVMLLTVPVSRANEEIGQHSTATIMTATSIAEIIKEHAAVLMAIPGVVGVGQGLCEGVPCIKVYVVGKTTDLERDIPDTLDGYRVVIEEAGEIKARSTARGRPSP